MRHGKKNDGKKAKIRKIKFFTVGSNYNKKKLFYGNVPVDKDGWVTDLKYRPLPFDLILLKMKKFFPEVVEKIQRGWWTKENWDGYKFDPAYAVLAWKKENHFEMNADIFGDGWY